MATMTQVHITNVQDNATLYHRYPRQGKPQDCYIQLDCRDGSLAADWNGELGNGVPESVWLGHVRRYPIPILQNDTVNQLMRRLALLAQRVVDGYECIHNGHNYVANLSDDASAAEDEIARLIEREYEYDGGDFHYVDAADWMHPVKDMLITDLRAGISVDALVNQYQGDGSDEDAPVIEGLYDYLRGLQEQGAAE